MNKHIILGNISSDIDVNEKYTKFAVAVRRAFVKEGGQDTDFFTCVVFGSKADLVAKFFKKGDKILLEGRTQVDRVEKDGSTKYYTSFIVENFHFVQTKSTKESKGVTESLVLAPEQSGELPF